MMKRNDKIRMWVSRLYVASGCSCCRDDEGWHRAAEEIGKLLDIPTYSDESGRDFYAVKKLYDEQETP